MGNMSKEKLLSYIKSKRSTLLGVGPMSLNCVDAVVLFQEPEALNSLVAIKPDTYVKGGDYTIDTINQNERKALEALGTQIKFIPFKDGFSTTMMIDRILDAYGSEG